jgi:hypothetical protein
MMTNPGRYVAMAAEYVAYVGISIYLHRSERARAWFGA